MAGMNLKAIRDLKVSEGLNILDVEIPPQLDATVDTGMAFLNDAFGGEGITPSTCAILTGDPGAGKTTLMLQMAESMTKMGHQVVYNGREEAIEQMRKVTRRLQFKYGFIIGQERQVPQLILQMKKLRATEIEKLQKEADAINDSLKESVLAYNACQREAALTSGLPVPEPKPMPALILPGEPRQQILIVDSLQSHDDGFYKDGSINSMTQVRVTEQLTDWCKETYGIAIIIGQVTKNGKVAGKQQIIHTLDVHCHMTIERDSDNVFFGCRLFGMIKNRFGCSGITYALDLTKLGFAEKGQIASLIPDNEDE